MASVCDVDQIGRAIEDALADLEELHLVNESLFAARAGSKDGKAESEWDVKNVDLKDSGKVLKKQIIDCCKKEFSKNSPIDLIERNIPSSKFGADFKEMNEKRKAVQYDILIEEKDESKNPAEVRNKWTVEMDADKGEGTDDPKKFAHFGFTVTQGKKTSGHVYLKEGQAPKYVRPPLGGKVYVRTLSPKKEKKGGEDNRGSIYYCLSGDWSESV